MFLIKFLRVKHFKIGKPALAVTEHGMIKAINNKQYNINIPYIFTIIGGA